MTVPTAQDRPSPGRLIAEDSARWGIAPPVAGLLLVLPLVLAVAGAATAVLNQKFFHGLMDEDHLVEWLQFAAILGASVAFAVAAVLARRAGRRGLVAIFALVAVGAFVVAGEEISWGQRILGFATPEALEPINHQGESNLHNISAVQRLFNLGQLLSGLYGLATPILLAVPSLRARLAALLDPLLVPPLCLVGLFALPFAYRALRMIVLPEAGQRITEFGEIPELAFYCAILAMGLATVRILRRSTAAPA